MNQQEIINFLWRQSETADIWPWFVSVEEMVGDTQRLQEVVSLLAEKTPAQSSDDERLSDALTEVFGENPTLAQTPWQEM